MGVGAAVADGAADASLTRGGHGALTWSSVAPDLGFTAAAAGLEALVLAAVGAAASCRRRMKR